MHGRPYTTEHCVLCSYVHFWHFPFAHALLYGVIKDFWKLMLRSQNITLPGGGDHLIMSKRVQRDMSDRVRDMQSTSSMNRGIPDVSRYVCRPMHATGTGRQYW